MNMKLAVESMTKGKRYNHDASEKVFHALCECAENNALDKSEIQELFELAKIPTDCAK